MSANAHFQEAEPFDPTLLMAGVDVCSEGLAVVRRGRILYANHAFARTSGVVRPSELRGRLLRDLLPPDTKYPDSWETRIDTPDGRTQLEASSSDFKQSEQVFQMVSIRAVPLPNRGDPRARELEKIRPIGQIQSEIAHDFGNLMTGILLYSDLLIERLKEEERLRRHAQAIRRSGINGVKLMEQLMAPARGEPMALQPSSFSKVASEMATFLTILVGDGIDIYMDLSESLGLVKIDAVQVHQIIVNLVTNARDAMPMGGKITLVSRNCTFSFASPEKKQIKPIPSVEFLVTDTGIGMDKKVLAQVFRPFFTTKPRNKGNGLGLPAVRSAVKEAGGEVEIESAVGKGTTVIIRLPQTDIPDN